MKDSPVLHQLKQHMRPARKRKGYAIDALAARLNISARHLAAVENGSKRPSLELFCAIAKELDLSLDAMNMELAKPHEAEHAQLLYLLETCNANELHVLAQLAQAVLPILRA